ncbi:MAG: SPOR domain-containing protein [Betaproteobacteria bacterium]
MALFKNRKSTQPAPDAPTAVAPPSQSIDVMRRRARHRLIGAVVLVLLGVVGFPMLFDSQPRPVAVDIPIEIPDKAKAKPLVLGAVPSVTPTASAPPAADPAVGAPLAASAGPEIKPEVKPEIKPEVKPKPVATVVPTAVPVVVAAPKAAIKPDAGTDDGSKARALLEGDDAAAIAVAGRFVVQVGAFSDSAKLREVRQKLEKAGIKTYTQVVDTKDGKRTRVRVGPFTQQADADKSAAKIKAMAMPAAVLKM